MKKFIFFIIYSFISVYIRGQDISTDTNKTYYISVRTEKIGLRVILDSINIGKTPVERLIIRGNRHYLQIKSDDLTIWEGKFYSDSIYIDRDTILSISLSRLYLFNSEPYNAKVIKEKKILGYTPLRYITTENMKGKIDFSKQGYRDTFMIINDFERERSFFIKLSRTKGFGDNDILRNKDIKFKSRRNYFAMTASALISIGSGYLGYKFKNDANDNYDLYIQNKDRSYLDNTNKFDIYSGISILIMQVAILGLIYFLFID